jgi:hypothetical protein
MTEIGYQGVVLLEAGGVEKTQIMKTYQEALKAAQDLKAKKELWGVIDVQHLFAGEIITHLITQKQVKYYSTMPQDFRREVSLADLPTLYTTQSGYIYAVVNDTGMRKMY